MFQQDARWTGDLDSSKYFSRKSCVQPKQEKITNLSKIYVAGIDENMLTCCNLITSDFLSIFIAQKDPVLWNVRKYATEK